MADEAGTSELELLGTSGCHLCEEADSLLLQAARARAIRWRQVDIAADDSLVEAYGRRIPVLRRGGRELAWPFSLLDILRFAGCC